MSWEIEFDNLIKAGKNSCFIFIEINEDIHEEEEHYCQISFNPDYWGINIDYGGKISILNRGYCTTQNSLSLNKLYEDFQLQPGYLTLEGKYKNFREIITRMEKIGWPIAELEDIDKNGTETYEIFLKSVTFVQS